MLLVTALSQRYLVNFILSFIFTFLNHVISILAIYFQSITNLVATSIVSAKSDKSYKTLMFI